MRPASVSSSTGCRHTFPRDEHGLRRFDGSALYEHEDPRKGEHADWGTLIFNYGRREVVNYLIGSALYWIDEFHIDGIRVDAVASMLYLDYSREEGEWLPNEHGGNENLEAVEFIKRLNTESTHTVLPPLPRNQLPGRAFRSPVDPGGLGFTYKWNMGWMNDTLSYMGEDPLHRKYHHDKMTFGLVYAFNENFVLPLSHDEVVHGKHRCSAACRAMTGSSLRICARTTPICTRIRARNCLFMGNEFAQQYEWNHDQSLDWHLLEHAPHTAVSRHWFAT